MQFFINKVYEDARYAQLISYDMIKLSADANVCAMAPYDKSHKTALPTAMPVAYTGQVQVANDDTKHLRAYDQMLAQSDFTATSAYIEYIHCGSIIRVAYKVGREMTLKSMVLSVDEEKLVTDAALNMLNQTMAPTAYAESMELGFSDVTVDADETLTAYLMVAPTNLSGKEITIELVGADESSVSAKVKGTDIEAGKTYNINIGDVDTPVATQTWTNIEVPASNNLSPVVFAPDFPEATVANGELKPLSLLGDANADGVITMADANMVVNYFLGSETNIDLLAADVNEDGTITMADANMIVNMFLGIRE
ncbi:MAG: fimbrillin family protein [Prevotella sp.]|nr:fimbrillin family protein [Prevotella sp.]